MKTVTLYGKPGCHLCDDVRAILEEIAGQRGFVLTEVNIESDSVLDTRYRFEIPVVMVDGAEIARGRISERELLLALAAVHL